MADHDTHDHTGVTGVPSATAPNPTTIELGHASDTTLARVSAGVVSIEGTNIVKAGAVTANGVTMATARLLGRTTASTGAVEEITVGSGLSLAAGALTATGGGTPAFVGAQITNTAVQTIAHDTLTSVTMDTETWDTDGFHTGSSANMVIPSGKDGKYLCIGGTRFAANTTGTRTIAIGVGGTRMPSQSAPLQWGISTPIDAQVMAVVNVVATNTIQLLVHQDSGGNLDVGHASAAFVQSNLTIIYLGA